MKLLIAGGGTGGHIFPGIAVAACFQTRAKTHDVVFIGSPQGLETTVVPKAGFRLILLPISGLRRMGAVHFIKGVLQLPVALILAVVTILVERPNVALSVGGYAAGPAILVAALLRIPTFVLEQNSVPGFTNKLLGFFARAVFVAFPDTQFPAHKTKLLGNPVRKDLIFLREQKYTPKVPLGILVLGGSRGARAINEVMVAFANYIQDNHLPITVTHQTGSLDYERVKNAYQEQHCDFHVTAFIEDVARAYRECDLVICRAGAMTLAEITLIGRPSILVPFPFATDDHQHKNAEILEQHGAARVILQKDFNAKALWQLLKELVGHHEKLEQMADNARFLGKPRATEDIVDLLLKEAQSVSR